jgi:hypothetical protein
MHYEDHAFSKDPSYLKSIKVKENKVGKIKPSITLSETDVKEIRKLYNCKSGIM